MMAKNCAPLDDIMNLKQLHWVLRRLWFFHFHVNLEYRLNREMEEKWIVRVRAEVNNPPLHVAVPNSS